MSAAGKNLEAISRAVIRHNGNCPWPIVAIEMCHYEVERLGFDNFNGIPIVDVGDKLPTGRFNLVCEGETPKVDEREREEAAR